METPTPEEFLFPFIAIFMDCAEEKSRLHISKTVFYEIELWFYGKD